MCNMKRPKNYRICYVLNFQGRWQYLKCMCMGVAENPLHTKDIILNVVFIKLLFYV